MNYEPFGSSSGESGSEDYRYTGKPVDVTGLYYFGARYYDPDSGRFTTRDTVFGHLNDPQSQNRYVYCLNNPHKYVDPDGKRALTFSVTGDLGGSISPLLAYGYKVPGIGGKVTVEGGFVICSDEMGMWEMGFYYSHGIGPYFGSEADVSGKVAFKPEIKTMEDLAGSSVDVEIQVGIVELSVGGDIMDKSDTSDSTSSSFGLSISKLGGGTGGGVLYKETMPLWSTKFRSPWYTFRDIWSSMNDNLFKDSKIEVKKEPLL